MSVAVTVWPVKSCADEHENPNERCLVRDAPFQHQRVRGIVADVALQDAPDGDVLSANEPNRVEEFFFRQRRQRVELNQVDHRARRLNGTLELARWRRSWRARLRSRCVGRSAKCSRWNGTGCIRRSSNEWLRRAALTVACVKVVARDRLGGERRVDIRHDTGKYERIAIGRALDFNRRMHSPEGALEKRQVPLNRERELAGRSVGKPHDDGRATGFASE